MTYVEKGRSENLGRPEKALCAVPPGIADAEREWNTLTDADA